MIQYVAKVGKNFHKTCYTAVIIFSTCGFKRLQPQVIDYYYYYFKWHRFLLSIHHPVVRLDNDGQGVFQFIFFYCCNCFGCFIGSFRALLVDQCW